MAESTNGDFTVAYNMVSFIKSSSNLGQLFCDTATGFASWWESSSVLYSMLVSSSSIVCIDSIIVQKLCVEYDENVL